ncbi:prepilin peptidase [Testudinibacter sp. P80/BLE/0925]|uniref:prepilin peptidase n=1 Tax=Testudinibacter sp. TW-1 TaxID=3417757 RepID=UPI003D36BFF3
MFANLILLLPIAALFGYWVQRYTNDFALRFNRILHNHYQDYYAPLLNITLAPHNQWLSPLNKPWRYLPLSFVVIALMISTAQAPLLQQIWWLYCLAILTAIALVDWHYRLISTLMCQQLLLLALFGGWQQLALITLAESVQSLLLALLFISLFFMLSRWFYQREVFGEGDCWLVTALAAFFPAEDLPLLLLLASSFSLLWIFIRRICGHESHRHWRQLELPFAPSLVCAALILY